jgi:hypothetical protein
MTSIIASFHHPNPNNSSGMEQAWMKSCFGVYARSKRREVRFVRSIFQSYC